MRLMIKGLHIEEIYIDTADEEEEPEPVQEEPKEAEPVKYTTKPKVPRKVIDKGKVGALYKAGWSVAKIADEMRCNQSTIYRTIKELGL